MAVIPEIRIPGCKILSELGKGGMAVVYLGIQEKLDRKVAVKILEPSLLKSEVTAARFEKEARTAAMLSHSNIVQIFDTGKEGNYHYIIMEYLEESLKDRMKLFPQGKMHPPMALDIVEGIMKALDYAHFRGVFHRDIKPDNIMFKQDSTPVLVDFGIARVFDSPERVTKEGVSLGTSHYMSPEQCKALLDIDGRSDIYSLGVIFYEMLTGKKPYEAETQFSLFLQHIKEPVPKLPPDLNRYQPLIDKMMAKDREKRLSSGAQFVKWVDRIMTRSFNTIPQSQPEESPPAQLPIQDTPSWNSQPMEEIPSQSKATLADQTPEIRKEEGLHSAKKRLFFSKPNFLANAANSFKKYSPKKKIKTAVLVILPVILATVILIVLLSSGSDSKQKEVTIIKENKETSAKNEKQSTEEKNKETQGQRVLDPVKEKQFQEKYKLALRYIEEEDFQKAEPLVEELGKIKDTKETKKLAKKINRWKDREFERYLSQAYEFYKKKDYHKAKICIVQARQFKTNQELKVLEESVDNKLFPGNRRNR